jgi:AcrR family transcriptional regulator
MPGTGTATSQAAAAELSLAHGDFAPERIEQIQRARLLAATVQAVDAHGVANLTVAGIVTRAGVSRRTFYELFDDCEACLLAALEDVTVRARARVLPAYEGEQGGWHARIRAGLLTMLRFFDEQPQMARLLVVEWLAAGPRALEYRRQVIERLAGAIDEGRAARPRNDAALPKLTAEGIVGAVASLLHARLVAPGASEPLVELANPLMGIVVLPYLGPAAARRELGQVLPDTAVAGSDGVADDDVFKGLKMRLTYRTMCVLAAVAANPGGSNRTIARAAGIGDQGQISKLLLRLSKLGLVENRDVPIKGEPNAWVLSPTGERVERLLAGS